MGSGESAGPNWGPSPTLLSSLFAKNVTCTGVFGAKPGYDSELEGDVCAAALPTETKRAAAVAVSAEQA